MIIVVSPAKNLDVETPVPTAQFSQPQLLDNASELATRCKSLSPADLSSLMSISDKLAILNAERFDSFNTPFTPDNARQAMFMFNGDVYTGLDAYSLSPDDIEFAQQHLRILSGLYGVLRPLDLIQPYRLEMGTKLDTKKGKNLYQYWDKTLAENLNQELQDSSNDTLVNLASNEYFKAVKPSAFKGQIITPVFKDKKSGQYKVISFFAKKARGLMARYIIQQRITTPDNLKQFDALGYYYDEASSTPLAPVFLREEQ